jgi:DNA (cytosine-5)-methyltransferase 1
VKPRLLDLFCGAGGAAVGYRRAGFDVTGVDIAHQSHYPFRFVRDDALNVLHRLIEGSYFSDYCTREQNQFFEEFPFDAIHASPPCQRYANVTRWRGDQDEHPDLIAPTRELLEATGLPYVLENVRTKALRGDFMLCGTTLGLPIRRHRHFETNWSGLVMSYGCQHKPTDYAFDHGAKQPESVYRDAMGCEWMTVDESREAIPPAYTELIGHQLMTYLKAEAAA